MKTIFKVWVFLASCTALAWSESSYDLDHLSQEAYHDPQEGEQYPNGKEHQPANAYQHEPHVDVHSGDLGQYQNLEARHHQPGAYSVQYFKQYYGPPHHEPQTSVRQPQHYGTPDHVQYNQPEDPSYHRPQEIVHHQPDSPSYHRSEEIVRHQPEEPSYHRPEEITHHQPVVHHQVDAPIHGESYHGSREPEPIKEDNSNYKAEEPKYTQAHSPRSLVRRDPKLPLYFTMYEKRTIQDPLDKYGKGPWRYLTYGHGISYGSKGPGKVFEKGYGYIRALGRDHCKLPEHLCPPKDDDKPFEYEGRKEPYFGYRPH